MSKGEEGLGIGRQPTVGIVASILVVAVSIWVSVALRTDLVLTWVNLLLVSMVPIQMVIGLVWHCKQPAAIAGLPQPIRGLAFLLLTVAVGMLVAMAAQRTVGGGLTPPTPFVNMFVIFSVVVTIWLIIPMQCWPFTALLGKQPVAMGFALLLTSYALAWILFNALFDFGFLHQAPFYSEALDPHGKFNAWNPLTCGICSVATILSLVLLDFWPVSMLARTVPAFGRQPLFGIASGVLIALIVTTIWQICVAQLQMDVVQLLVRAVSMIFGVFIVLVMFEGAPFVRLPQPMRGLVLITIAALLAVCMNTLYRYFAVDHLGLTGGAPGYTLELWLATSMLAITFPFMVFYASFFDYWPLRQSSN
jgi:hypothetical protein